MNNQQVAKEVRREQSARIFSGSTGDTGGNLAFGKARRNSTEKELRPKSEKRGFTHTHSSPQQLVMKSKLKSREPETGTFGNALLNMTPMTTSQAQPRKPDMLIESSEPKHL